MIYAIIFGLLVFLELAYFGMAKRFNIVDRPNSRSSHSSVTLRGGGIIFLFGIWLYSLFFGWEYSWFVLGLSMVGLVSFADDIHSLPDSVRLIVQFAAMFMMFGQFGILNWHDWWMGTIGLVVCVGIVNAYNFMDGINGITGGYSLAVIAPLVYLNTKYHFISMPFLFIAGMSLLIFCFFNFRKRAVCFAGDVGSISMAFIVIFALGKLILATNDFSYIVFIAVYGADTILTICHRIQLHEKLGEAHRKHAFQIMANELGIPHVEVTLLYMILQLTISFGLIASGINHYIYLGLIVCMLLAMYLIFMKKNYHLHREYLNAKGL